MDFTEYFQKYPPKLTEISVIEDIHHMVECAEYHLKEDKDGKKHEKYIIEAYKRIHDYLKLKGVNPDEY